MLFFFVGKKMKFKKIYIEITNRCNLACSFCAKTTRPKEWMSQKNFLKILKEIQPYTHYIYLHVMGEPLLHPEINEFIQLANERGFEVNLTTNGTLLDRLSDSTKVRQINISLHACKEQTNYPINTYLNRVFEKCEKLNQNGTDINYRIWRKNNEDLVKILENRYSIIINSSSKKLKEGIFYSNEAEFLWPINRLGEGKSIHGTCRALKDHIGILVDGTVVPCCLDNNAQIVLGNIFKTPFSKIINSPLFCHLVKAFNENKKVHPLCQSCSFYEQRKKNTNDE